MAEHADTADGTVSDAAVGSDSGADAAVPGTAPARPRRTALAVGLAITVALGALAGWQGYRFPQSHSVSVQREHYVQVARQGALNLTTIDWEHADRDVQRILDSATGEFREDFAKRSKPFVDVVTKAHSKSEGTITESALESQSPAAAQVLVVTRVAITNAGAPEQAPRSWRMRISVQKVGDDMKISQVAFVP